ncbi:hypothetical protein [Nocardioides sp.]|uniref:hypothetical protein n=1 Tax=Nocardioides sp. TaxID=35761 RepID=UPI00261FD950|nr:hypothetical protein [Nocardioides sp.]MDI6908640.1 hypothetical protein [Nocardioides sp.]
MITLTDVKAYLGTGTTASDAQIQRALVVEQAAQKASCRPAGVDTDATAVLDEALLRRIAVNLARRGLPLGMQMSDVGAARISTSDPEVRRLEAPYRKVTVG